MAEWHAQGSSRVPQPRLQFRESGGLHRPPLRLLSLRQAQGKQGKRGGRKPDRDALAAASALRFILPQLSGQRLRVLRVFFKVCQRRRLDAVEVRRFNRLARLVSHLLRALETFRALGIEFVSLSEQVDTSTPTGKMVFTVLGDVAEPERSLIAERVKAGL